MRSINTNTISGPQAVCVAAFGWWWAREGGRVRSATLAWLEEAGPTALMDKTDWKVGEVVLRGLPFAEEMTASLEGSDPVAHMLERARSEWRSDGMAATADHVREFLRVQLRAEVGQMVLQAGWFDRHKREIDAEKRRRKTVRAVLEG